MSIQTFLFILLALLFVTFPAIIASQKGRNFALWFIFALLLYPAALIASILIKDEECAPIKRRKKEYIKCPKCPEIIKYEAQSCKYCKSVFERKSPTT